MSKSEIDDLRSRLDELSSAISSFSKPEHIPVSLREERIKVEKELMKAREKLLKKLV